MKTKELVASNLVSAAARIVATRIATIRPGQPIPFSHAVSPMMDEAMKIVMTEYEDALSKLRT